MKPVLGEADARVVADAIDDVPPPGTHPHLIGHENALSALTDADASGRMHHAWLLAGPKGIGKTTFAFATAVRLLSRGGDQVAAERQIAQGAHPGLLHLARTWDEKTKRLRTQISVDDVRRTQRFFGLTASAGESRVCIVDAADEMSVGAANALLKILEEPPADSIFFVVTHAPGRLLPTIRSRCRQLTFQRLEDADVSRVLAAVGPPASEQERLAAVAAGEGVPRQAILSLQGDVLKQFATFTSIAERARGGERDWSAAHALADKLSSRQAGSEFEQFEGMVFGWLQQQVRAGGEPRSLVRWATLWEKTRQNLERGHTFNLDRKQLILDLFADLFETLGSATHGNRTR